MIIIPGFLISLVTFPGVIVHEIAHRFFCDLAKVPVYEVKYFRLGNPAGYVIHSRTNDLRQNFLISIGPLIVNTILCALIAFPAVFPLFILNAEEYSGIFIVLLWIAFSIGMHAFPSNEDIQNYITAVKEAKNKSFLYAISWVFGLIVRIANLLRFFWFDAIYAFAISMILPLMLVS